MSVAFLLVLIVALAGSATLAGVFGWMFLRIRRLEQMGPGRGDPHHLLERFDAVREELEAVHDEVGRLSERVDFTERLLEPGPVGRQSETDRE